MGRFDEGPYAGGDADGAPRRPESLFDLPGRPPANSPHPFFGPPAGGPPAAPDLPYPPVPQPALPVLPAAAETTGPGRDGSLERLVPTPGGRGPEQVIHEPTQRLPTVKPLKAAARAVIVYQEVARRPWRLWAFTAVLVALTVGVILGQTVAFEPTYRPGDNAQAAVVPATSLSPVPYGTPASPPAWPDAAHRVTAPLGTAKSRVLEVVGNAAVLRVRSADLGKSLVDIATVDRSAVPRLTTTGTGATLELIPTGDDGTVGAEIQLNSKVAWTLKLSGGLTEQSVDMQAGGLAGLQMTGGSARTTLLLPAPKGTVPLALKGPLGDLTISTRASVPLRFTLTDGAASAVLDGKTHRNVKPGTTLTSSGWGKTDDRYDVTTTGKVTIAEAVPIPPAATASPAPSNTPSAGR